MRRARSRRLWAIAMPILAASAAAITVILISGGDEEPEDAPDRMSAPAAGESPAPSGGAEPGGEQKRTTASKDPEKAVVRAARGYLEAIDARDGARVCTSLVPGAIEALPLPRERGDCAASLNASIGYRDPRGFPVFDRARIRSMPDVVVAGEKARVTATVVTEFADRDQPSIEEDVIYLADTGDRWRVVKPSSTLYRAVGEPDVPPDALAPP